MLRAIRTPFLASRVAGSSHVPGPPIVSLIRSVEGRPAGNISVGSASSGGSGGVKLLGTRLISWPTKDGILTAGR